jgi:iron complex transport system substrate-binding protein
MKKALLKKVLSKKNLSKKMMSCLLAVCLAAGLFAGFYPVTADAAPSVTITLDGQPTAAGTAPDAEPYTDSAGRTMVPVRFISEALGVNSVNWNETQKTVSVFSDKAKIVLTAGSDTMVVNGARTQMDTVAVVENGRTFVPLRYIAEALGIGAAWDSETRTVALTGAPAASSAASQTFTDSVGRAVTLPAEITRVSPSGHLAQRFLVAIAPELLVSLGSAYNPPNDKYVSEELNKLPVVGSFYGSGDLNYETIAGINPEVVIDLGDPKNTVREDMDSVTTKLAIPAVHITAKLDSAPAAFRTLGKLLNREARGEELAKFCERILSQTDGVTQAVGTGGAGEIKALWVTGVDGNTVNIIGSNEEKQDSTYSHSEVIDLVADNVADFDVLGTRGSGNESDFEYLLGVDPDFIIVNSGVLKNVSGNAAWDTLSAVKNNKVVEIPSGPDNWMGSPPSINRYLGLIWLTKVLYPAQAAYDVKAEIQEYYSLFYGKALSDADYAELTANAFLK